MERMRCFIVSLFAPTFNSSLATTALWGLFRGNKDMPDSADRPHHAQIPLASQNKGRGLGFLFYILAAVFFWPVLAWGVSETLSSEQNVQAICLLLLSGIYLVYLNRSRMRPVWNFDSLSIALLAVSFAFMMLAGLWKAQLLVLVAFCFALASFVRFVFGGKSQRVYLAMMGGFVLYLVFLFVYPKLGWPLSVWSGYGAQWVLAHVGYAVELRVLFAPENLYLLLIADNRPFSVLPNCNGFSLLSAAMLVSFIFLVYRKTPLFAKVLWLIWTMTFAYLVNVARICLIVILVPYFPDNFVLMHEVVGLVALYLVLWVLWYTLAGWHLHERK